MIPLHEILLQSLFAGIAALFFSVLFSCPRRAMGLSAALAGAGYLVYMLAGQGLPAFFAGAALITIAGETSARAMKMPATVFIHTALIPMVPGVGLYRTMLYLVQGKVQEGVAEGAGTLLAMGCMAIAIAVCGLLFRVIAGHAEGRSSGRTQ